MIECFNQNPMPLHFFDGPGSAEVFPVVEEDGMLGITSTVFSLLKGSVMVVTFHSRGETPPWSVIRFFHVWTITSLLITRFFFPTPEMKARDQAVRMRHWNKESVK